MHRNRLRAVVAMGLVMGVGVSMMPGCIAWEIRDELRKTNNELTTKLAMLETTNDLLAAITVDMGKTNELLGELKADLGTTNTTMGDIQGRLAVLEPITKSLDSLDESLKTVKSLIEKIPFVGAGDEEEPEAEPAPGSDPGAEEEPAPEGEPPADPDAPTEAPR
jgi:hypothetical protein